MAVGELAGYAHLTMVLGVTVSSVGDNLIIEQPFGETQPSWIWVIFGGPALFLIGRALLDYAAFSRESVSRPIGLILLAAFAPVALQLPPVVGTLIGALVLAAIAIYDGVKWRWAPPALPHPGASLDETLHGTLGTAADQFGTENRISDHRPDEPRSRRARLVADGGGLENR